MPSKKNVQNQIEFPEAKRPCDCWLEAGSCYCEVTDKHRNNGQKETQMDH